MRTILGVLPAMCGLFALLGTAAYAQTVGYTLVLSEHPQLYVSAIGSRPGSAELGSNWYWFRWSVSASFA